MNALSAGAVAAAVPASLAAAFGTLHTAAAVFGTVWLSWAAAVFLVCTARAVRRVAGRVRRRHRRRMRAADYKRLRELEAGLGWELSEIPAHLGPKYDWSKYGHPGTARLCYAGSWFFAGAAGVSWPEYLWLAAVTHDWTTMFAPVLVTAYAAAYRVLVRKVYGVRP